MTNTIQNPRLFPGWPARIVIVLMLTAVLAVRLLGRLEYPPWPLNDSALCNLLQVALLFVALLTAWAWICFRSGYPLVVRRVVFGAALIPLVLFAPFIGLM